MTTHPTPATRSNAMPDTDHDTAAVLTEAEREDFLRNLRQNLGYRAFVIEDTMLGHVERIAAGAVVRLAAQPPQDDPQPDEREALTDVLDAHADVSWVIRLPHAGWFCTCGHEFVPLPVATGVNGLMGMVPDHVLAMHRSHFTDAVLAAGFRRDPAAEHATAVREAEARALREAADDMDRLNRGGWRPGWEKPLPAGTSGAIVWLRDRADHLRATDTTQGADRG